MSERRDDTPEREEPSPPKMERGPGKYYYDDATGYEIYHPSEDDEDDDEREQPTDE